MLYLYRGNAVLLQHFRGYFHGRDLLCGAESVHREGKREESQRADVCAGGIIYPEIYLPVEEVGYRATLNLGRSKTEFYYVPNCYFPNTLAASFIFSTIGTSNGQRFSQDLHPTHSEAVCSSTA